MWFVRNFNFDPIFFRTRVLDVNICLQNKNYSIHLFRLNIAKTLFPCTRWLFCPQLLFRRPCYTKKFRMTFIGAKSHTHFVIYMWIEIRCIFGLARINSIKLTGCVYRDNQIRWWTGGEDENGKTTEFKTCTKCYISHVWIHKMKCIWIDKKILIM